MAVFRILHLSDLHFGEGRKAEPFDSSFYGIAPSVLWRYQKALASWRIDGIARLAYEEPFDLVLLSGDIADSGQDTDLGMAIRFVDGIPKPDEPWIGRDLYGEFPTLSGAAAEILPLPGNHDRYYYPWWRPGNDAYDAVFGGYWTVGQGVQLDMLGGDGGALAVVSADCSLRDSADAEWPVLGVLGQGRAYDDIVRKLQDKTTWVYENAPDAVVLWALHFAPRPPLSLSQYPLNRHLLKLAGEDTFLVAARTARVKHVLCGHFHRTIRYHPENFGEITVWMSACGSRYSDGSESLPAYEISVSDGEITSFQPQAYEWNAYEQKFTPTDYVMH